jgi:MFS superfamily sulfate permease-like transporter
MKKTFMSLVSGLVFGLILSVFFFDYRSITNEHIGLGGVDQTVRELDFDFVYSASLLIAGLSISIFVIWSFVEKKQDQKFLEEYANRKKSN